jgi:osmotically-inducible protein OsmY
MTQMIKKSDSQIQQDVLRELKWDTRVEETDVGVEVDGSIVTLTGTVDSWAKRLAAQEAAHRVSGVRDVANDIQVKLPGTTGRTDTDLARAIRSALEWDVFVPEQRITSTVTDGWVTLDGEVDSFNQREDAASALRNLAGIRGVTNRITVKPAPIATGDLRESILGALERHAAREARNIGIDVRAGKVILTGKVGTWAERQAVIGAVRGTRGVKAVDDQLSTDPYA